ncbi:MAG: site-specific DNA-methyltransferase [Terriglobales bacterium]|jgi:adenine-specific DNA-methyltransferase
MANGRTGTRRGKANAKSAQNYKHPTSDSPMRPEVGTQAQFKKRKEPKKYRYDDSLSPALEWDGQNPARERGEALIREALQAETLETAKFAVAKLKAMSKPFLNWAGKAERISFDVPTLPLFIHERLSTKAILETLKGHKRDKQTDMFDLFGDPQHSIADQVLRAYEHRDKWVNRMILGDSLVVMNSLLRYENLGGQVQMIYLDPPYGVKFGSNFQPFVRKRDVQHNDDEDMTREPEMVQAYRDIWELNEHSYLNYLRDRLFLVRDLLAETGSIFVQISDQNLHHVRELLDEVFGNEHFCGVITFVKTSSASGNLLSAVSDYLLWYAKDKERVKYRQLYLKKEPGEAGATQYTWAELPDGTRRNFGSFERLKLEAPPGSHIFQHGDMTSQRPAQEGDVKEFAFDGKRFTPGRGTFKSDLKGLENLARAGRLFVVGNSLRYVRFLDDFPVFPVSNMWDDTGISGFAAQKLYVVQTTPRVIERCLLMTTDPGDLVLDPTCGSGTTSYVAEQWGRRWITIDTSRVPLALARQRLLTATFDWYGLNDESRGPAAGFVYKRKQNTKGEEVGGIVPHVTLKSIANNEPPEEEVLVDRPEIQNGITRVTGPFTLEATIPTPQDFEESAQTSAASDQQGQTGHGSFVDRMLEILRKSPVLRLEGNKSVTLKNVRPPAKTLALSAEAMVDATAPGQRATLAEAVQEAAEKNGKALPLSQKTVAFVFGPENGAVSEKLVYQAAKEANAKNYTHLYVIGFAIQPNARMLVEQCAEAVGIPATYVQATPDLMMGDLLKHMRSSQIFSVCGLPEAEVRKAGKSNGTQQYEVELLGLDVFDPIAMEAHHGNAEDVPAWFLDTDYNGLCFHVSQAFFPRTGAWEGLKKALKGEYEDTVWDHLAGTVSAPFETGEQGQVAIKVIDDRGNELLIVKSLREAK